MNKSYSRSEVTWACGALKKAGWVYESNADGSWEIQTPTGWETAKDAQQLNQIARRAMGNPI